MSSLSDTSLSRTDSASDILREKILDGRVAPGDLLAESAVAKRLGVSRVPVREARFTLGREGLVEFSQTGRAYVKRLIPQDFDELYMLRITLEPLASRLAAPRLYKESAAHKSGFPNVTHHSKSTNHLPVSHRMKTAPTYHDYSAGRVHRSVSSRVTRALCTLILLTILLSPRSFLFGADRSSPQIAVTATASSGDWTPFPDDAKSPTFINGSVTLTSDKWSGLVTSAPLPDATISASITITEPAKGTRFFGQSWSAWPDATFSDDGFEAALLLRSGPKSGFRVQISHRYQCVALVKWPEGGYVQVVPCAVTLNEALRISARAQGSLISASINDQPKIAWHDTFLPLTAGSVGLAASGGAKVLFTETKTAPIPKVADKALSGHVPDFSVRPFLGDRLFVFDGNEPILQLHHEKDPSIFAKLRPGYKPQVTFDSHWDLANQGAFKEAASKWTAPKTSGGGSSLNATWSARHVGDRFTTSSTLTVGYDVVRGSYTYDIDSALEMLPGEPFHFRYGFDFEHHTPLDPFRWQYLVVKRAGNAGTYHRPVYPIDPGPQYDIETAGGSRVWFGRHGEEMHIAPAVEYAISMGTSTGRKLNTAVCAAFYDTGVSFPAETAKPGTRIEVKYRYTGVPANEAKSMFDASEIYKSSTLDPNHHYVFADEWPKLTFSDHVPMSQTWIYGRTPFMTGHNQRPTYELVKDCGAGSGFAMRLGPASYGKASLRKSAPLRKGRYIVSAIVKADNVHGPGGRIELATLQAKTNKRLSEIQHFIGNGTFDWRTQGFAFDVPEDGGMLEIAFGNAGTGSFLITDVEFRELQEIDQLPSGVLPAPQTQPATLPTAPAGAIADFRMLEGKGHHTLNHAGGDHLGLANLQWVNDEGRPALRFADNLAGRADYNPNTYLGMHIFGHAQDQNYLSTYKGYEGKQTIPFAMGSGGAIVLGTERYYLHSSYYRGLMGRVVILKRALNPTEIAALVQGAPLNDGVSSDIKGMTLAAWIKPDAHMVQDDRSHFADIIGYGNRAYILSLQGDQKRAGPYKLVTRLKVNDILATAEPLIDPDRWYHVAMTAEPRDGQRYIRLFLDGRPVADGTTKKWTE